MTYRVYSGPKGTPELSAIDRSQMLFKQFVALDEALAWARHVTRDGRVPLLIEGDDGTSINRREIGAMLGADVHRQVEH
ncbi:MAG: hypothetical protein GC182_20240 [Rhodopseudomonas sp.]|nr:hypothetical protein [Rhodopseudomonas sp.]